MITLPYGRQDITQDDIDAVLQVLKSDLITQGPKVEQFESAIADYCGVPHAVAVNSATSALHLACLAMGVGDGDLVWTSPITFVASANCVRFCGAEVGFVDIDPKTYNLCPVALEEKLYAARKAGKQIPKLIIAVHFAGQPCDMQAIDELAQEYGFRVIEDASHAIGGRYRNKHIGNCQYSDVTVFSFHPVKIITCGEGGVAVSRSRALSDRMRLLRTHGVQKTNPSANSALSEPWRYEQRELGYNYRMTDIQAALGLSQLGRLEAYIKRRHELARRYDQLLAPLELTLPYRAPYGYSAYHLYPVLVEDSGAANGLRRRDVFNYLVSQGIGVNVHYIPVHTQPYYQELGHRQGDYPNAEAYYARTVTLPLFGSMTFSEQDRVVGCLFGLMQQQNAA